MRLVLAPSSIGTMQETWRGWADGLFSPSLLTLDGTELVAAGSLYVDEQNPAAPRLARLTKGKGTTKLTSSPAHFIAIAVCSGTVLGVTPALAVYRDANEVQPAFLAQPLDPTERSFVAIVPGGAPEIYALLARDHEIALLHWTSLETGWRELGLVPAKSVGGQPARCAWDATRRVLVVVVHSSEAASQVLEWDGASWAAFPARYPGVAAHVSLHVTEMHGGADGIALSLGGKPGLYLGNGVVAPEFGRFDAPTCVALGPAMTWLQLRSHYEGGLVWLLEERSFAGELQLGVLTEAAYQERKGSKKPAKKAAAKKITSKKPAAKPAHGRTLAELFEPGLALLVLDAIWKKSLFDYDAWVEAGLADGSLTLAPTDDADQVRAWKMENELGLNATLEAALVALTIPEAELAKVRSLSMGPLKRIIRAFCSQWDGEDELGQVRSLAGLERLPNLEKLSLIAHQLELEPLLQIESLKTLQVTAWGQLTAAQQAVLTQLRERGVSVKVF